MSVAGALLLAFAQRDEPWTGLIWLFLFVVLPLLARLVRALLARAGLVAPEEEGLSPAQRAERLRRRREERRRAEAEGEDLWRRLARGEDVTVPTREIPLDEPVVLAERPRTELREVSLELEEEAEPLSVLGRVSEPSEAPEASLETEAAPVPLSALVASPFGAMSPGGAEPTPTRRRGLVLARGDLRRAVLLSEILGPPVSDRPLRI